jgi:hypothetical protein
MRGIRKGCSKSKLRVSSCVQEVEASLHVVAAEIH